MSYAIQHLFVYPIKSIGGVAVKASALTARGLQYDRRMMLVDENGLFLTQREHPKLALFKTEMEAENIVISSTGELGMSLVKVPLDPVRGNEVHTTVWSDSCLAFEFSEVANAFFSRKLNANVRLVYMPEDSHRYVDPNYAEQVIYAFSDGFPILVIGSASLVDLNKKLQKRGSNETMNWDRFRPNIVVSTELPFVEDKWKEMCIQHLIFKVVKPCSRCVMTTINQTTAAMGKEPLRTLSTYRTVDHKVLFGQNVINLSHVGEIHVGDMVEVKSIEC